MALTEIGARLRLAGAPAFSRDARKGANSLDRFGKSAQTADRRVTGLERTAKRSRTALAGVSKAGALFGAVMGGGAVLGIKSAVDAASNLNESLSKSRAVFGQASGAVEAFASDSKRNILLTKQAAIEGTATFGNLFTAMGIGQRPAAGLSTKLTALASDLSSFNNVDTEDALLSLRSGLLGEAEPLRKFGVQLSATRIEAEAFALGLAKPVKDRAKITAANNAVEAATKRVAAAQKKYGVNSLQARQATDGVARAQGALQTAMKGQKVELTAAQKAQAAYSIIMKDTKTAQGDAARTSGGYANATRILQKKLSDTRTEIGQKLLPAATRAAVGLSKLVDEFKAGTGTGGQFRDVAEDVGGALKRTFDLLNEHRTTAKVLGTAAVGAVAFVKAMKGVAALQGAVTTLRAIAGAEAAVAASQTAVGASSVGAAAGIRTVGLAGSAAMVGLGPFALALAGAYGSLKLLEAVLKDSPNLRAGTPSATIALPKQSPTITFNGRTYWANGQGEVGAKLGATANPRLSPDRSPVAPVIGPRLRAVRANAAVAPVPIAPAPVTIAPVIHMHGYNGSRQDAEKIGKLILQSVEDGTARR